jgi:hypothetical protein
MVQRYPQKSSGSSDGWCSLGSTIGIRTFCSFRGNPVKKIVLSKSGKLLKTSRAVKDVIL